MGFPPPRSSERPTLCSAWSRATRGPPSASRSRSCSGCGTRGCCARSPAAGVRHFTSLSQADRERVLLSWADSRVAQRRAAFQALRKGALLAYYGSGGANGDPNPAWDAIGYPGPLGPPQQAPPHTLTPVEIDADTTLDCDVVIVGSGAGGGTAAGVLAQAGLDVVIVEAGGYYDQAEFDGAELARLRPALPQRRRHGERGRQRRPAGRQRAGRRHARELHVRLPPARRPPARVGGRVRRRPGRHEGLRPEPRRGLGAHRRQRRAQRPEPPRREHPRRARQARLGLGRHAAQRPRLPRGGLPPLSLRLPARRQAVDAQDLDPGRPRRRRAHPGRHARRQRHHGGRLGARHRGAHRRRPPGDGAGARRRQRLRRAAHPGAAGTLGRPLEGARQEPAPAPGDGHLGSVRRGDPALGGDARVDLLRPRLGHGRQGLRRQVRARRHPAEHPADVLALARWRASTPS